MKALHDLKCPNESCEDPAAVSDVYAEKINDGTLEGTVVVKGPDGLDHVMECECCGAELIIAYNRMSIGGVLKRTAQERVAATVRVKLRPVLEEVERCENSDKKHDHVVGLAVDSVEVVPDAKPPHSSEKPN